MEYKALAFQQVQATSTSNTYKESQQIRILVSFNENIYGSAQSATITSSTAPKLQLIFGSGTARTAYFYSASAQAIEYIYTIQNGDNGTLSTTSYSGKVFDEAGNSATISSTSLFGTKITADTTEPSEPTYKKGDINGDDKVDLTDVLKIRRHLANQNKTTKIPTWELSEDEIKRADINGNESIDLSDTLILRRYIASSKSETVKKNHPDWYWEN